MKKNNVEILAPAGDSKSFFSAINNGADAIYLGIDEFNARANVENFNLENLKEYVSYAHLFGVKIYLTLNILLKNEEFDKVFEILKQTSRMGVDAYIFQDIGLIYFIKHHFPNLELHASTQMGLSNVSGVKFASKLGFSRVVLSRETPLEEIRRIKEKYNIEIEYFVQGALCVAFSGNCYLCSMLNNNSGNRGKCKQFCRLKWDIENKDFSKTGYLLSTKDFNMSNYLRQLKDAGIDSFKIEGRARRESYVGGATSIYKKIVENDFSPCKEDEENLIKLYNRGGFIPGYFNGNDNIIYSKAQNHIGQDIGKVKYFKKGNKFNVVSIESNKVIHKDDVLKFFMGETEEDIITVKDIISQKGNIYNISTTHMLKIGLNVRRVVDSEYEKQILQNKRTIKINAKLIAKIGEKAKLILMRDNVKIEKESEEILEKAKTNSLTEIEARSQVEKLGDDFSLVEFSFSSDGVFMAKSVLNKLRRETLEMLKNAILKNYEIENNLNLKQIINEEKIEIYDNFDEIKQKNSKKIVIFDDFNKIKNFNNDNLYVFKPSEYKEDVLENLYKKFEKENIFLSLPIIASQKEVEILRRILDKCPKWGVYANNYYAFDLRSFDKIIVGENMNVCNDFAVKFYSEQGAKNIVLSKEFFVDENIKNSGANLFKLDGYYSEYMTMKHCPIKANVGGNCANCLYNDDFVYKLNGKEFSLKRNKIVECQFVLKSKEKKFENTHYFKAEEF